MANASDPLSRRSDAGPRPASFFEQLLALSPCVVFRLAPGSHRITYVSPNVESLLGYGVEEALAEDFWARILHPDDGPRLCASLRAAERELQPQFEGEYRFRTSDGRERWFLTLLRVEYQGGEPMALSGFALDISERKAAEEQLRQAQHFSESILESLPAIVFVKDARTLRYVRFNRAAEEMLQLRREDAIGRTDADVFGAALADAFGRTDRFVLETGRASDVAEEVAGVLGGEARILHTKKIPVLDDSGRPLYLVGVSVDITAQRHAHEEARRARLEAERASRAKSEFLSRMSHDVRTPLNAVLGFAQLLQMDRLTPEQADSVQQIVRGGVHLLQLVNEVLDIARIEAGQLSLFREAVPLDEAMREAADLVRPLGHPRGVRVTVHAPAEASLHVSADRQRLRQVLVNLLANAVKYNRDDGHVGLSCAAGDEGVRVLIEDTGQGIAADKLPLLFQPFERLGADRGPIEGTGLGLAVSKALTEAMGGRIGVQSVVGRGSTFWIELPRTEAPPTPPADRAEPVSGRVASSGTVLYVEDNQSNIRLVERLLARRPGVRLATAGTGEAALAALEAAPPDLMLLDLHLPDMSGEELLRRILAEPRTAAVPVAVLSADATADQQQRLLAAGAVAYLTKPVDMPTLLRLVDEQLDARSGDRGSGTEHQG